MCFNLSAQGCTSKNDETQTEAPAVNDPRTPKPSKTPTPTPTPKSLVDEAENTARRDKDLEDRIEAVEYLLENDLQKGLSSGNDVISTINFRGNDFWEFFAEEPNAKSRFLTILTVLSDEGHEDILDIIAVNLHASIDFWEGHEETDTINGLLRQQEWFELLTIPLAGAGWFEAVVFGERDLQNYISLYIDHESLNASLQYIKYLNINISPSLAPIFGSLGGVVFYPELSAHKSIDELLPSLGTKLSSETLEDAKFLVIEKDIKPGEENFRAYVNLGWQTFIPEKHAPESIETVTHIIVVDTTYEYYSTYNNKITKGYSSNSTISIYNFATGELNKKINTVITTAPPANIQYSGSAPERKFAGQNDYKIFELIYNEILSGT